MKKFCLGQGRVVYKLLLFIVCEKEKGNKLCVQGVSVLRVPQDTILRLESAVNGYSNGTVTFNIIDQKKRYLL